MHRRSLPGIQPSGQSGRRKLRHPPRPGLHGRHLPRIRPAATLDDGSCITAIIAGCTDPAACNYDPTANADAGCFYQTLIRDCNGDCYFDFDGDGVCDSEEVSGCRYPAACNYDPAATDDDGSCLFVPEGRDCDGNCLSDSDGDGVCDPDEIEGCTDPLAVNYLSIATDDSGNCAYLSSGCADLNFDGAVTIGDLSSC